MSRSRKDGKRGGGHRNTTGKEYWKSRLHTHGETPGRVTKRLTHRKERREGRLAELARRLRRPNSWRRRSCGRCDDER